MRWLRARRAPPHPRRRFCVKPAQVIFEAARAICCLKDVSARELAPAITVLQARPGPLVLPFRRGKEGGLRCRWSPGRGWACKPCFLLPRAEFRRVVPHGRTQTSLPPPPPPSHPPSCSCPAASPCCASRPCARSTAWPWRTRCLSRTATSTWRASSATATAPSPPWVRGCLVVWPGGRVVGFLLQLDVCAAFGREGLISDSNRSIATLGARCVCCVRALLCLRGRGVGVCVDGERVPAQETEAPSLPSTPP